MSAGRAQPSPPHPPTPCPFSGPAHLSVQDTSAPKSPRQEPPRSRQGIRKGRPQGVPAAGRLSRTAHTERPGGPFFF